MRHILPINTKLPETFLDEEDRCGFSISSDMKAVWAVQIDLLERFKEVCRKYGLRYYASSGTLLGAVRHKGYIPWDDDLDVVMFRKEWFEEVHTVPFEFTDIIIQDKFDPVLKQDYGDYMIMRHEATYHGTLTLDPYRAFDEPA